MFVRVGAVIALQAILGSVLSQGTSLYPGSGYSSGNKNSYAQYGSTGGVNKGAFAGSLGNNAFNKDTNRLRAADSRGFSDGFTRNDQGRANDYYGNTDVKNTVYSGGGGDGNYFSSSTSNNKNDKGGLSSSGTNNAYTSSTSSNKGGDGIVTKSFSGNIGDVKEALGGADGLQYYQDGQEGIQAAVNSFGSGALGGIVGPKPFDYSRKSRPSLDTYAPVDGRSIGNKLQVGYVDSFLNPQPLNPGPAFGSYNTPSNSYNSFGGPSTYKQYNRGRVFRPVQVRESNSPHGYNNGNRPYAPIITNSYSPPTTYSGTEDPRVDSFFEVTNPLSNKKNVISGYRPSNNFVDPSHFIIPKKDKYEMVDQLFGGGVTQFGKPREQYLPAQRGNSFGRAPRYSSVDEGLKNLGNNYYSDSTQQGKSFNLGFFDDEKDKYSPGKRFPQSDRVPQASSFENKANSIVTLDASGVKNPAKATVQSSVNTGGNQASYKSGQGFENRVGYSDQGRQDFDNSYNTKSSTGNIGAISRGKGQDSQFSQTFKSDAQKPNPFLPNPAPYGPQPGKLLNPPQQPHFGSAPQSTRGDVQYQGSSVFDKRQDLTPLFNGFSPNNRLTVDEFKNKNLLGDPNFGHTEYDRRRPTSTSNLGSALYRQANFGGQNNLIAGPKQQQPYNQAFQTNQLSGVPAFPGQSKTFGSGGVAPQQDLAFGKGGNGYNLISGKTQTTGSSYDDGHSSSQGYTNSFDDSISKSGAGQDSGKFAAYGETKDLASGGKLGVNKAQGATSGLLQGTFPQAAGGAAVKLGVQKQGIVGVAEPYAANRLSGSGPGGPVSEDGGFSNTKTYQSSDSYNDKDGFSTGDSYSDSAGYRDGNTVSGQYSTQDENQKDYRDGYEKDQSVNNQHTYSNTDGYNDGYTDGKKYDQSDGYTDNINYSNKKSDASQSQYSTGDGYQDGVANVKSAVSGRAANPYTGVRDSPKEGLSENADYKPFDVNGPVSFFNFQ